MTTGSSRPTGGQLIPAATPAGCAVIKWVLEGHCSLLNSGRTLSLLRGSGGEFVGKGGPEWQGLGVGDFGGEVTEFAVGVLAARDQQRETLCGGESVLAHQDAGGGADDAVRFQRVADLIGF